MGLQVNCDSPYVAVSAIIVGMTRPLIVTARKTGSHGDDAAVSQLVLYSESLPKRPIIPATVGGS
jgi:hypothetical protein